MMRRLILSTVVFALITGCQSAPSLQAKNCPTTNWNALGKTDAEKGDLSSNFTEYKDICATTNVIPDEVAYMAGYKEGLTIFCTFNNGQNQGRRNIKILHTCPAESAYYKGHEQGLQLYNQDLQAKLADRAQQEQALRERHQDISKPGANNPGLSQPK